MRQYFRGMILLVGLVCIAQSADAHRMSMGGFDRHPGGHGGDDFGYSDSLYFGFGGFNTERRQERFEDIYDSIVEEYDTGLEEIEDFYLSEDYTDILGDMEWLVDEYDLFLSGVEYSIDRLDNIIELTTGDLEYFADLIADYEVRDDLSEARLDRILSRLTTAEDRLTTRLDALTEQQATLSENLLSYQDFELELQSYLEQIVTAGGTIADDGTTAALTSPLRATAATEVPEPSSLILATLLAAGLVASTAAGRRKRLID